MLFLSSVIGSSWDGYRKDTFLFFRLKGSLSTVSVISGTAESRHSNDAGVLFLLFVSICAGLILSILDSGSQSGVPNGSGTMRKKSLGRKKQRKSGKLVTFSVVLLVYLHTTSLNICPVYSKPGTHKLQSASGAVPGLLPVFVSGLSSESRHTCSSMYCLWLLLCYDVSVD